MGDDANYVTLRISGQKCSRRREGSLTKQPTGNVFTELGFAGAVAGLLDLGSCQWENLETNHAVDEHWALTAH